MFRHVRTEQVPQSLGAILWGRRWYVRSVSACCCLRPQSDSWSRVATAIIWVIDSTDKVRMCVVQDELENMFDHKHLRDKQFPILFFANKVGARVAVAGCSCLVPVRSVQVPEMLTCVIPSPQMDLPSAYTAVECMEELELDELERSVFPCVNVSSCAVVLINSFCIAGRGTSAPATHCRARVWRMVYSGWRNS